MTLIGDAARARAVSEEIEIRPSVEGDRGFETAADAVEPVGDRNSLRAAFTPESEPTLIATVSGMRSVDGADRPSRRSRRRRFTSPTARRARRSTAARSNVRH